MPNDDHLNTFSYPILTLMMDSYKMQILTDKPMHKQIDGQQETYMPEKPFKI